MLRFLLIRCIAIERRETDVYRLETFDEDARVALFIDFCRRSFSNEILLFSRTHTPGKHRSDVFSLVENVIHKFRESVTCIYYSRAL